jgi:outer membrane protease
MKKILTILIGVISLCFGCIYASNLKYSLEPGYYSGYTTYQIGGYIDNKYGLTVFHFPVSDLKFPLNVYSLKGTIQVGLGNNFIISISGLKNLSKGAGLLEDSDWLKADYEKPDIYSESTSILDIWQYDFKLKYKLRYIFHSDNNYEIYWLGIGYLSKQYDFVVNDLKQWYPREPEKETVVQSGKVLTYRAYYKIPYLEFASKCYRDKFGYGFNIGIAPSIQCEDRDDHIHQINLNLCQS